ncbi:nucleoporin [Culex quinquefasciatus]|uniref:Nucleoporin n=1 Tax=Culex quinquefasciatus TaxID=7176 RepID=B0X5S6_CULQU|nr:nucleoporin [Culex quinquefasciatus]|eukprot:XP_001864998.1 nucleoporin [Culex quinquefasciatus]
MCVPEILTARTTEDQLPLRSGRNAHAAEGQRSPNCARQRNCTATPCDQPRARAPSGVNRRTATAAAASDDVVDAVRSEHQPIVQSFFETSSSSSTGVDAAVIRHLATDESLIEKVKENSVCKLTPIFKISKVGTKEPTAVKPAASGLIFESVKPATSTNTAAATTPPADKPFSFGFGSKSSTTGTGFRFPNVVKPTEDSKPDEKATTDDDEDESFKVEFTPVKEKDSIFSKPCTNCNYSDRGIGTLHIKKMDGKVQVLETKPPPTSVLLWVKTGEEADELYETLLKQKPN